MKQLCNIRERSQFLRERFQFLRGCSQFLRERFPLALSLLLLLLPTFAAAQRTEVNADNIATVRVAENRDFNRLPVPRLGSGDEVQVTFDELSHDFHRYTYRIVHLDATFKPTESLFESDYLDATADEGVVEHSEQSMNTSVLYTHYRISLPNDYMRPLLSGNYALTVYNDADTDEPEALFKVFFHIVEDGAAVNASATTDTDIDRNGTHQQIDVALTWQKNLPLRDPDTEIYLVALQNDAWQTAVCGVPSTGQTVGGLTWTHCRSLIFPAGNEYRKFEVPSTRYPGMHVNAVGYRAPHYHAELMPDAPRRNYLYDEDQNGRYVPLSDRGGDPTTEAEYVWVHFLVDASAMEENPTLMLDGRWATAQPAERYQLEYHPEEQAYTAALFLKQGYYSYRYLCASDTQVVEGNYWQAENEYTLLVYYRQTGARYDRLIAHRTASYRPR